MAGFLSLLAVSCVHGGLDSVVPGWESAKSGWTYQFPRDHGPHRSFRTEWWYATGNLRDESGSESGFQLTFFRQGIRPGELPTGASAFRVTDLPFAHFTVSDIRGKTFRAFQSSSRGSFGEAGFGTPPGRIAWIGDWILEGLPDGAFRLAASGKGRSLDLRLDQERQPLIHGHDGISPKSAHPGHASHYYSLTRLQASGMLAVDGRPRKVSGSVWFDHEWSTDSLEPDAAGWDWSGLHLDNGEDLMIFRIRDKQGKTAYVSGTLRDAKGSVTVLKDLSIVPSGSWKSPSSGGTYPASLEVTVPEKDIALRILPKLPDQELRFPPFAYWEGAVRGEGTVRGEAVRAEGYLELTGYGGAIRGVNGK